MVQTNRFSRLLRGGLLFLFTLQLLSCKLNSEYQHPGAEYLQGEWVQERLPLHDELLQYALHELRISCDSIYVTMHQYSKVKNIPDSCFNEGAWDEYAKGVYVVRGDSLIVDGLYTKSNWKQKISGCYRIGQYLPRFKIVSYSKDSLVLQNRFDPRPIVLRKTAEITCVPKKRWE